MWFQVAELSKLAKIPFGSGGVKTKVTDYLFCGEFVLIGHKFQNIDQFLCQTRFIICSIIVRLLLVIPSSNSSCASTSVTVEPSIAVECVMMEYR